MPRRRFRRELCRARDAALDRAEPIVTGKRLRESVDDYTVKHPSLSKRFLDISCPLAHSMK